jgi:hypothetical protein
MAAFQVFMYGRFWVFTEGNGLAHRQAMVDFESETFGRTSGIRLGWIIFDRTQRYRGSCRRWILSIPVTE